MISAGTMFACQPKSETINNYFDSGKVTQQNEELVEGTINGGGGKGIRCVDPVTKKPTLQLLDLYEAEMLYGLETRPSPAGSNEALDLMAELMGRHFWNPSTIDLEEYKKMLRSGYEKFISKDARFIPAGKRLKPVADAFEPLVDPNCELVQIAVYYDESILLIDQELWKELDWLNRMALYVHEVLYAVDRSNGVTNSISVRKLVGQMFSSKGARPRSDGAPSDPSLHATCHINNNHGVSVAYAYMWQSKKELFGRTIDGVEMVFNYLENISPIFRTSIFFENTEFENLLKPDFKTRVMSNVLVDSYYNESSKYKTIYVTFKGNGQGDVVIRDDRTGTFSEQYGLNCYRQPISDNKTN